MTSNPRTCSSPTSPIGTTSPRSGSTTRPSSCGSSRPTVDALSSGVVVEEGLRDVAAGLGLPEHDRGPHVELTFDVADELGGHGGAARCSPTATPRGRGERSRGGRSPRATSSARRPCASRARSRAARGAAPASNCVTSTLVARACTIWNDDRLAADVEQRDRVDVDVTRRRARTAAAQASGVAHARGA